jgi:hypothetical protein
MGIRMRLAVAWAYACGLLLRLLLRLAVAARRVYFDGVCKLRAHGVSNRKHLQALSISMPSRCSVYKVVWMLGVDACLYH